MRKSIPFPNMIGSKVNAEAQPVLKLPYNDQSLARLQSGNIYSP